MRRIRAVRLDYGSKRTAQVNVATVIYLLELYVILGIQDHHDHIYQNEVL